MYRVLSCLTTQHDYRLLALAILVCVVESFVALYVYWQVSATRGDINRVWLAVAGLCTGGSIWATHFIAMLAYDGGVATAYEPVLTAVSLAIAFILTTLGLSISAKAALAGHGRLRIATGGAVIGVGTIAMHFTGMQALQIAGVIQWQTDLVITAIVLGIVLSAGAMLVFHRGHTIKTVLASTGLLVAAIIALHTIAMSAVTIIPDPTIVVPESRFSNPTLALAIVMSTVVVLAAGFIASVQESRAARASAHSTRELVNAATDGLVLARDGIIVDANHRTGELWGRHEDELRGSAVFGDLLVGERVSSGDVFTFETHLMASDGSAIPVEILRQPLAHAASGANEVFVIDDLRPLIRTTERLTRMNDELHARQSQLHIQNMRFDTAMTHMTQGLCMFDGEQRLVVCNRRFAELYAMTADELKPGTTLSEIIEMRIARGIFAGGSPDAYRRERITAISHDIDMVQELNDGRSISISLRLMPGGGYVSTHEDVTERRRMEEQLVHLAHHDPLTDLPNRLRLRERLEKALKGAAPERYVADGADASISTASRRSTTRSGIWPATR